MKKIFTLTALLMMALAVNAQAYRKWDFTNWSATTVANLIAGDDWSDIEKAGGTAPTDLSAGNCFWQVSASTGLKANGVDIEELEGLSYTNTTDRSLAIAVNYQGPVGDGFGPYHGPSYLWLGSSKKNYFIIPRVLPGTHIKMGVESHKLSDARGVQLYLGAGTSGTQLVAPDGSAVAAPKEYTEQEWVVPTDATDTPNEDGTFDIQVYNTNGCHIYFIEVGDASQKSKVAYLYNGTIDSERAYAIVSQSDKYVVEPVEATGALSFDALTAYDAIVISSTVNNAEAIASLKTIQPFVPTVNLNPALYAAWGYGAIGSAEHQFVTVSNPNHALFRNLEIIDQDEIIGLPITNEMGFKGVTLATDGYFSNDVVLATVMESEDVAIHGHNLNRNGYLFIPYTQETLADAASPALITNALSVVANTKVKVAQAPKPQISLEYKNMNTNVTLKSNVTGAQIFYTIDGTEPTEQSTRYTEPFNISQAGVTVKAAALGDGYLLSEVAEQLVDLKQQAKEPAILMEQQDGKTIVTLSYDQEGAPFSLYYNYSGSNETVKSTLYSSEKPIELTKPRTIYAFAVIEGMVNSEVASAFIPVQNAKVRLDVLAHMDANSAEYNGGSTSTAYYFSWGKNKSGENSHPYYNPEVYTIGDPTTDPDTGDEIPGAKTYTELNPEEAKDFENGWMVRSRGQIVDWENLTTGENYGDNSGYNFATVEDNNPDFPATKSLVNLADKNTEPSDATFPYNAYITTTAKYAGPFDIVINVASITKPDAAAKHLLVLQTSADGNVWESTWQTVGDTISIEESARLTHNITRSYEGTDEVYVRAYLCGNNSKVGFYDIYLANAGEKTQEYLTGISSQKAVAGEPAVVYSLNGARQQSLRRGLNIVRYSDGTTRKVMMR